MRPHLPLDLPFVGRDAEMGLLCQALEESVAGSGRVVLLTGEPGIGKTRTAHELAVLAGRMGAAVLVGRGHDGDGAPAYWPWAQIVTACVRATDERALRSHLGSAAADIARAFPVVRERLSDLPGAPAQDSNEARFRLFDGITNFLVSVSAERPLVVFLDDLHCADVASLRLLEFVVRDAADARLLIVGTYRDTEIAAGSAARNVLGEITRHGHALWLQLRGLGDEAIRHLMAQITGGEPSAAAVARVRDESAGNPFFILELLRLHGDEGLGTDRRAGLPPGVQEVIRRRLARLSAPCNEVLRVAAVLGCDFDGAVLERACDLGAEVVAHALDEATAADLVTQTDSVLRRVRFKHALVRETVRHALDSVERSRLHRRIGEALEALHEGQADPPLAELAHHFLETAAPGCRERGIAYSEQAARRALGRLAYEEAVAHLQRALAALDLARPAREAYRCDLLLSLGGAHVRVGDSVRAREVFLKAAEVARSIGAPEQLARAALGYGSRADPRTFNPDVISLLEEALGQKAEGDSPLRAQLLARLAREVGAPAGAALGAQAVGMARRLGDPVVLTTVLIDARFARWGPDDLPDRLREATDILRAAEASHTPEAALTARLFRVIDLLELGRIADVDHELAVLDAAAQELRQPWYLEHATALRAMRARLDGRYDEAERLARAALDLGARVHDPTALSTYAGHRLDLCRERGDLGEREVEAMRQLAVDHPRLGLVRYVPPWLYAELGRYGEARCELERVAAYDFADVPRDMNWLGALVLMAETAASLGDVGRAATLYELLRPYAGRVVVAGFGALCAGSTSFHLGRLATTLSRWTEAEGHLGAALDANRRLGALPFVARTQYAHGAMLCARGDPADAERARALWHEAANTAETLGMIRLADQVRHALADEVVGGAPLADSLLRREGEYWTIIFDGRLLRVRDTRGVRYLARLVGNPGRELLAVDLVSAARWAIEPSPLPGSAAGDVLDVRAVAAYRRRLDGLRDALQEARTFNDPSRAAQLESEIEWLARQLSGGLGLHGRRRAGSSVERARLNVRKGIATVLHKLGELNPALGRHLAATVRTGTFCSYTPDPRVPIAWKVLERA
jgi:tetratricopeptide (TPR) repeat protein